MHSHGMEVGEVFAEAGLRPREENALAVRQCLKDDVPGYAWPSYTKTSPWHTNFTCT